MVGGAILGPEGRQEALGVAVSWHWALIRTTRAARAVSGRGRHRPSRRRRRARRVLDPEAVQRSKLRIETRKWVMSKLAARRYGDKIDVNVIATVEVSALSDEELEARTRARLVALGVEVAAPLLLTMPGAAPAPATTPEPEPVVVDAEPAGPVHVGPEPAVDPRSTRKKSAADLLGLVV